MRRSGQTDSFWLAEAIRAGLPISLILAGLQQLHRRRSPYWLEVLMSLVNHMLGRQRSENSMRANVRLLIVIGVMLWVWGATFFQVGGSPTIFAWLVIFSMTLGVLLYRPFLKGGLTWLWAFGATFVLFLAFVGTGTLVLRPEHSDLSTCPGSVNVI